MTPDANALDVALAYLAKRNEARGMTTSEGRALLRVIAALRMARNRGYEFMSGYEPNPPSAEDHDAELLSILKGEA